MGIYSRDYYREDTSGNSFLSDTPSCKRILIATIAIYIAQLLFVTSATTTESSYDDGWEMRPRDSIIDQWLALDTDKVLQGQVWRLGTYALLHSRFSIWHILINMIVLYWFGRSLELNHGSREFMIFYIVAAVLAGVAFLVIQLITGDRTPCMGASGATMAVFCLFAMWNPGYTINIYFLFPVPVIWLLGLYIIYDLHPLILQLSLPGYSTGVANAAHLGGAAFGFLYYRQSWRLEPLVNRLLPGQSGLTRTTTSGKATGRSKPQTSHLREDTEVDEILAKISREGESSLTQRERKVLLDASQRYRARKG